LGTISPGGDPAEAEPPQRVSTLELFFDLVFVFTITQLTSTLAGSVTVPAAGRLLLVFGVLWWMYGGYAWLTNARTPSAPPERLLLLLGMAGFLVIGLSIPHAFGAAGAHGRDGLALGLGYLVVVGVHSVLYFRVNRNIRRILPFNLTSPVLVIIAGFTPAPAAYGLWAAALAVQVIGPFFGRLDGRFAIRPAHFVERHGALMIVAFGESVAGVGIGAEDHPVTFTLALSAALGLALTAALWWAFFGTGDDDRAGSPRYRALAAVLALAAWPLSVAVDAAAGIALLTAVTAGAVATESRARRATVEA
jgi:low temperature requirement protein LtrA